MSLVKAITASEATVAAGTRCVLHSISFSSDDEDLYVKCREDGVVTGTVKIFHLMNATSAIGEDQFQWVAGDPRGCVFDNGLYIEITKDGTTAGTGTINVEYTSG